MVSVLIVLMTLHAKATRIDIGSEGEVLISSSLLQSHKHVATTSNEPNAPASSYLLQSKELLMQLPADAGSDTTVQQTLTEDNVQRSGECTINGAIAPHEPAHTESFAGGYDDHTNGLQGLFVDPDHKLAFCLIEKNACSTWIQRVLQPLLYGNFSVCERSRPGAACKDGIDYGISGQSQRKHGIAAIEKIFHDPTATRAVFVRDPMERFASAFMSKCVGIGESGEAFEKCPAKSKVFRDTVEWLLSRENFNTCAGHWLPQAYHCELNKRLQGYNVVSMMSTDTFNNDMNCVLAKAGLDNFIKDTPSIMVNRAMSMLDAGPKSTSMDATEVLKKLFTKEAAEQVIAKYSMDYDIFGFSKEPAWLQEATGEWYDEEPMPIVSMQTDSRKRHLDKGRRDLVDGLMTFTNGEDMNDLGGWMKTSMKHRWQDGDSDSTMFSTSWVDEDIDDLGELAFRSGYTL